MALVARTRTGWSLRHILRPLRLSKSRYHEWARRATVRSLDDLIRPPGRARQVLPEAAAAVVEFALARTREGYRRLARMLVDEDVA